MKIKIIETTAPIRSFTIEKVKREPGINGEDPAGEYHRHTLDESDRIKRNSVLRQAIKLEKEIKKVQVSDIMVCSCPGESLFGGCWINIPSPCFECLKIPFHPMFICSERSSHHNKLVF